MKIRNIILRVRGVVGHLPRWGASKIRGAWDGLASLPRWATSKFGRRRSPLYRAKLVEEFPDAPSALTVYLAGESPHIWGAALICPCGCGDTIELNLLPQVRPRWSVEIHPDQSVTLAPSVWRRKGCKSHFFVRHGRVDWC